MPSTLTTRASPRNMGTLLQLSSPYMCTHIFSDPSTPFASSRLAAKNSDCLMNSCSFDSSVEAIDSAMHQPEWTQHDSFGLVYGHILAEPDHLHTTPAPTRHTRVVSPVHGRHVRDLEVSKQAF